MLQEEVPNHPEEIVFLRPVDILHQQAMSRDVRLDIHESAEGFAVQPQILLFFNGSGKLSRRQVFARSASAKLSFLQTDFSSEKGHPVYIWPV